MNEVWAEINGFPNYAISNLGEIVNIKYSRSLKPRVNSRGYNHVILFGDDGRKEYYVHQLVAQCFIGDFRHGSHIIHIDGDRSNNSVDNLRMRGSRGDIDYVPVRVRGRRVRVIETGQVFMNAYSCADYIRGHASNIYACLRGVHKRHMGYTFEYIEEEDAYT